MTCVAFSIKFAKTNQKFAENSEFCEKNSLLLVNYSLHSLEGQKPSEDDAEGEEETLVRETLRFFPIKRTKTVDLYVVKYADKI